ncbi:MAG: biopolymer transporter ExbD [Deltaproteobacteria bacterium]|nr:biopolymer transporter ExbD [Deltaproteobacteria bacterium]
MRIKRTRPRKKARIEIIPMIDTMFFLLVFFMVATMSMTVTRGLPVNLPKSDTGKKEELKDSRSITISKAGLIYLDKSEIKKEELFKSLNRDFSLNPEMLVIINADEEVSHGKVVEVMDTVKLSGITRLAIATKPR